MMISYHRGTIADMRISSPFSHLILISFNQLDIRSSVLDF